MSIFHLLVLTAYNANILRMTQAEVRFNRKSTEIDDYLLDKEKSVGCTS